MTTLDSGREGGSVLEGNGNLGGIRAPIGIWNRGREKSSKYNKHKDSAQYLEQRRENVPNVTDTRKRVQ
jgi:hypothetical protein